MPRSEFTFSSALEGGGAACGDGAAVRRTPILLQDSDSRPVAYSLRACGASAHTDATS